MADIKLFRSERLTDNPDGGGLATSTVVVDGEVNNVFDDISRIDRVNGDLSLRKVFALADGANSDLYSGLHAIVSAPPLDPRVSAVIFRTRRGTQFAWGDERADGSREEARPYEVQHRRFMLERRQYINRHDSVPRSVQGLVAQCLGDLRGSEVDPPADLQPSLVDPLRPLVRRAQADPQSIRRSIQDRGELRHAQQRAKALQQRVFYRHCVNLRYQLNCYEG